MRRNRWPFLLAAVERGERVAITHYGKSIAEIRPISAGPRRVTAASIDWIEEQLADLPPLGVDAVTLIEAMRAEDDDQ